MEEKPIETKDEVAFNLGANILEIIGGVLRNANSYSLNGHIKLAFHTIRQVTLIIDPKLQEKHRKILRLYETYFAKIVITNPTNSNEMLTALYQKYQNYIMGLLEIGGYLVPSKIDKSSLF